MLCPAPGETTITATTLHHSFFAITHLLLADRQEIVDIPELNVSDGKAARGESDSAGSSVQRSMKSSYTDHLSWRGVPDKGGGGVMVSQVPASGKSSRTACVGDATPLDRTPCLRAHRPRDAVTHLTTSALALSCLTALPCPLLSQEWRTDWMRRWRTVSLVCITWTGEDLRQRPHLPHARSRS